MKKLNRYGWYSAEYVKSTGLPKYNKQNYAEVSDKYLSKTRCARIKAPVREGEEPCAFYRVDQGYCGLYDRSAEMKEG